MSGWLSYFIGNTAAGDGIVRDATNAYFYGGNEFMSNTDATDTKTANTDDVYMVGLQSLATYKSAAAMAFNHDCAASLNSSVAGYKLGGHTLTYGSTTWNTFGFVHRLEFATDSAIQASAFLNAATGRAVGLNSSNTVSYMFGGMQHDGTALMSTNEARRYMMATQTLANVAAYTDSLYRMCMTSASKGAFAYVIAGFGSSEAQSSWADYKPEMHASLTQAQLRVFSKFTFATEEFAATVSLGLTAGYNSWRGYNSQAHGFWNHTSAFGYTMQANKIEFATDTIMLNLYQVPSVLLGSHQVANTNTRAVMVVMEPFVNGKNYNTYVQKVSVSAYATDTYNAQSTAVGRAGLRSGDNFQSGGYL